MDLNNIPNDKHDADIALKAMRHILTELLDTFGGYITTPPVITGTLYSEIYLIDKCLLVGVDHVRAEQYEADAKADHRTGEQFPNV